MKLRSEEDLPTGPDSQRQVEIEGKSREYYASEAVRLLGTGEVQSALHYLNLCLGKSNEKVEDQEKAEAEELETKKLLSFIGEDEDTVSSGMVTQKSNGNGNNSSHRDEGSLLEDDRLTATDEVSLLEKRCLIHMKLQHFDDVLQDARRILDMRIDHSLVYKCLLVALCKTNRLEQVTEILKMWASIAPYSLDMMECRTKLTGLIDAVKNGIEAASAFSTVEDQLGLSYDYLLARKPQDPRWKHRPLPPGQNSLTLCLLFRFGHCTLGAKCPDAHGAEELEEWKNRSALKNVTRFLDSIEMDSGNKYIRGILEHLKGTSDSCLVLTETLPSGVQIKCGKPLDREVHFSGHPKVAKWTFAVETKKPLTHVCLLHDMYRQYFYISSATVCGAGGKINLMDKSGRNNNEAQVVEISSPAALALTGNRSNGFLYKLDIRFKQEVYGKFRQTVVFDIGEDVKLARQISVEVVPLPPSGECDATGVEDGIDTGKISPEPFFSYKIGEMWSFDNAELIDGFTGETVDAMKLGFTSKDDLLLTTELSAVNIDESLTSNNYKQRIEHFLRQEEKARQEILGKYNLITSLKLIEHYNMTAGLNEGLTRYAVDGSLYGQMILFRDVSEDTAVGRLILRNCNYVLLGKTDEVRAIKSGDKPKAFLCPISDKTKNSIYIDIGPACVDQLKLRDNETIQFDIQFQLDRTSFRNMKSVVAGLADHHLSMLFPDFSIDYHIPWSPMKQWGEESKLEVKLNPRQKEALIAVTSESDRLPAILMIGPFGTGKTFTLAQCIRKLLTKKDARIMVCTHSNSAADLYIKEYFDPWVEEGCIEAKPLRVYYEMRNLNSVHPNVLQYCLLDNCRFRPPTQQEILEHKIIVVTLSTSYMLLKLDLPEDTFSHILLDEAAQAMESEAITPLLFAGENTKLVLAGDHMQLSPELFSEAAKTLYPSLLERLHHLYPESHPCKLMLCENYRAHSAIIDFVSDAFYNKKLQCSWVQPVHDTYYPITFFSARGEEVQEKDSTSYYNMAEVFEIVDKITRLISSWPAEWGNYRSEGSIGVLTPYSDQVAHIRQALRKKGLACVSVERVLNVQGKQFRAVLLSTVRSFRPWVKILPELVGNEVDLGFFSNPKLLNTALTRAQSLVAVVGDPVSLCSEGKCRNLWKDLLSVCHKNKSLYGISYPQLEQSIIGLEMRVTWGLNPLADVFEPKSHRPAPALTLKDSLKFTSTTTAPSIPTTLNRLPVSSSSSYYTQPAPNDRSMLSGGVTGTVYPQQYNEETHYTPPPIPNCGQVPPQFPPLHPFQPQAPMAVAGIPRQSWRPSLHPPVYFPVPMPVALMPHVVPPPQFLIPHHSPAAVAQRWRFQRLPHGDFTRVPYHASAFVPMNRSYVPPLPQDHSIRYAGVDPSSSRTDPLSASTVRPPPMLENSNQRPPQMVQLQQLPVSKDGVPLTQRQYASGAPLYQYPSVPAPAFTLSNVGQQQIQPPGPVQQGSSSDGRNVRQLPLPELLSLQDMLEKFLATNNSSQEMQQTLLHVRKAIADASGNSSHVPTLLTSNQNPWGSESGYHGSSQSSQTPSTSTRSSQQFLDSHINERVDSIWGNVGLGSTVGSSLSLENYDVDSASQLPLQSHPGQFRQDMWSTNPHIESPFTLTAQLSSPEKHTLGSSSDVLEGRPGHSYANIARRAVTNMAVGSGPPITNVQTSLPVKPHMALSTSSSSALFPVPSTSTSSTHPPSKIAQPLPQGSQRSRSKSKKNKQRR